MASTTQKTLDILRLWYRYMQVTVPGSMRILARRSLNLPVKIFGPSSPPLPSSSSSSSSSSAAAAAASSSSSSSFFFSSSSSSPSSSSILPSLCLPYTISNPTIHVEMQKLARLQRSSLGISCNIVDANRGHYPSHLGPYIFVLLNQCSLIESMIVTEIPIPFVTFANVEYLCLPFVGWLCAAAGTIPVVRGWSRQTRYAVWRASTFLQEDRAHAIYMSVEGQRSPDGNLSRYRMGCARIALSAQATIVPMIIDGARECLPFGSWRLNPGPCELVFLPYLSTRGLQQDSRETAVDLTQNLRALARQHLGK